MLQNEENFKYCRLVEKLFVKCQELQAQNERYVFRLLKTKKMLRRQSKDVAILKIRLDRYKDNWRNVAVVPHKTRKTEQQKRGPKPKPKPKKDEKSNRVSKKKSLAPSLIQTNANSN